MIFNLLRERTGKPGKAAVLHSHGEVLPFNLAGADLLRGRVTFDSHPMNSAGL